MTKILCNCRRLLTAVIALTLPAAAHAAVYTVAGFTWDSADSFTAASGTNNGFSNATPFPALNASGEANLTVGRLLGNGSPGDKRRVTVGSNGLRHAVTLTLPSGSTLPNEAGDDLVVYEQGDAGQPEAYAVAVRVAGSSTFSPFRYEIWDSEQLVGTSPSYLATGFDLSDFGLAIGASIDAIIVRNLTDTDASNGTGLYDYVPTGGQGQVLVSNSTSAPIGFVLPIGFGATKDQLFPAGEHDPDLVYVGVLNTLVVPEPTTLAALAGAGLIGLRRRRD